MIRYQTFIVLAALTFADFSGVRANELLVSQVGSKGERLVALDFAVQSNAVGFEVRLDVPKGASVDTSNCLKEVSGLLIRSCVFNGEQIVILAMTEGLKPLSPGILNLGEVRVRGASGELNVAQFVVSDPLGNPLAARVTPILESDARGIQMPESVR